MGQQLTKIAHSVSKGREECGRVWDGVCEYITNEYTSSSHALKTKKHQNKLKLADV